MSSTNILLLAVLGEVRRRTEKSAVRVKSEPSVCVLLTLSPLCVSAACADLGEDGFVGSDP